MTTKEILAIYKIAEKHWSRPEWLCNLIGWNNTNGGLCNYFGWQQIKYYYSNSFSMLWIKYRTTECDVHHFNNRKERLQAIRKVIKDLENEKRL